MEKKINMKKIKFAVLGYGNIGKRHVHHILQHPFAELIAVASLEKKPDELNCTYYQCLEDLLANEKDIDVINVCTPNFLHAEHCIKILKQKIHAVCEKPMALSIQECNAMIAAANENKKTIFVVKQNRYNPPVQQVKKLLDEHILGKIFLVNINCFWNRNDFYYAESDWRGKKINDGGCLFTQFSHFVDIQYYLFGKIKTSLGKIKNFQHPNIEIEDSGSFVMENECGAIINFNFSTCSYEKNMEGAITILAENGTVKIGGQYLNTIEYQHIKNISLPEINISAKANDYGLYQGSMSNHDKMIDNVVQHLNGNEKVMTNAYEGKDVVEIIEMMYTSTI